MDFVIPYEAIDYEGSIEPFRFQQYKVSLKDLDEFLRLKTLKEAEGFFVKHGTLLQPPPRYPHAAPDNASQTDDGRPYITHQATIILEAVHVLRFALMLRQVLDNLPKNYHQGIEKLGVEIKHNHHSCIAGETPIDYFTWASWVPEIKTREYLSWLQKDMLQTMPWDDIQTALDDEGNPIVTRPTFEGLAKEGRRSVIESCTELLDGLIANHLQDIKVVANSATPCLYPQSLISALWYLFASETSKSEITKCAVCGNPMVVHVDSKSAANRKKFCSNQCKQKNYREKQKRNQRRAGKNSSSSTK